MPSFFYTYKVYDAAFSEGVFEQLVIALACFLSFLLFFIASLIQILSLAWKKAMVILASVITVMKKEKILPNSAFTGVAQKAFLKGPNIHFFTAEQP